MVSSAGHGASTRLEGETLRGLEDYLTQTAKQIGLSNYQFHDRCNQPNNRGR